jgi:hypothetical protein
LILVETWVENWPEDIFMLITQENKVIISKKAKRASRGRPYGGLTYIIDKNIENTTNIHFVDDRLSTISFTDEKNDDHIIISAYMPTGDTEEYEECLANIDSIINSNNNHSNILIIGDMNADPYRSFKRPIRDQNEIDEQNTTRHNQDDETIRMPPRSYPNDMAFMSWLQRMDLDLLNIKFTQHASNSFLNNSSHVSLIDHIIATQSNHSSIKQVNMICEESEKLELIRNQKNAWDNRNLSDHRALQIDITKIKTEQRPQTTTDEREKKASRLNWSNKKHKKQYIECLQKTITERQAMNKLADTNLLKLPPELKRLKLEELQTEIETCIELGNKLALINLKLGDFAPSFIKRKIWWTPELEALTSRRKWVRFLWLTTGYDRYRYELNAIRSEFRRCKKKEIANADRLARIKLTQKYRLGNQFFWREMNKRNNKSSCVNIEKEKLMAHFKELFSPTEGADNEAKEYIRKTNKNVQDEIERIHKIPIESIRHYVDPYSIATIMKNLPNNKSPGPKGIRNEYFKHGHVTDLPILIGNFLKLIINGKVMPSNFNVGLIIPIIKDQKGDLKSLDNIRPITLSDCLAGIFENYILLKLNSNSLADQQFGFRRYSSTTHAIFAHKSLMRHLKKNKREAYALFIDYSKAFDKVRRNDMLDKIRGLLEDNLWLALHNYYKISKVRIQIHKDNSTTEEIEIDGGVKQGGQLSPTLFNHVINTLILALITSDSVMKVFELAFIIVYADDTTVYAENSEALKNLIKIIENFCNLSGLQLNVKKSFWMKLNEPVYEMNGKPIIRPPRENEKFIMNGLLVEKCDRFKFLGAHILSNNSNKLHIANRIRAAYAASANHTKTGLYSDDLCHEIKATIIQAYIRPRLIYGCESLLLYQNEIDKLIRVEGNIVKKSLGLSKTSYSTELYLALDILPLREHLKKRQLSFLRQLIQNKFTFTILLNDEDTKREVTKDTPWENSEILNSNNTLKAIDDVMREIDNQMIQNQKNIFVKVIKNCLKNKKTDGIEVLAHILMSKNKMRDIAAEMHAG